MKRIKAYLLSAIVVVGSIYGIKTLVDWLWEIDEMYVFYSLMGIAVVIAIIGVAEAYIESRK